MVSLGVVAADDPKQRQDLTAVIALNGKPCGEVVSYTVQGENDFRATCKDGNRYRVYVKTAAWWWRRSEDYYGPALVTGISRSILACTRGPIMRMAGITIA